LTHGASADNLEASHPEENLLRKLSFNHHPTCSPWARVSAVGADIVTRQRTGAEGFSEEAETSTT
jgi:hypothetical protein